MRSILAFSFLLALVHHAAAQTYAIGNSMTKFWIDTRVGKELRTAFGSTQPPANAVAVNIDPGLPTESGQLTNVTISDSYTGLYVGVDSITRDARLQWATNSFPWQIYRTDNGSYFIHTTDFYYWFDNYTFPTVVEIDPTSNFYYWQIVPFTRS